MSKVKDFVFSVLSFLGILVAWFICFYLIKQLNPSGYMEKSVYITSFLLSLGAQFVVVTILTFAISKILKLKSLYFLTAFLLLIAFLTQIPNRVRLLATKLDGNYDYVVYGDQVFGELEFKNCLLVMVKDTNSFDYLQLSSGKKITQIKKKYTVCYNSGGKQDKEEIQYPL